MNWLCEKHLRNVLYVITPWQPHYGCTFKLAVRSVAAPRHFMGLMGSAMHFGSDVNFNIAPSFFFSILMTQAEVRIFEPQFSNDDAPLE